MHSESSEQVLVQVVPSIWSAGIDWGLRLEFRFRNYLAGEYCWAVQCLWVYVLNHLIPTAMTLVSTNVCWWTPSSQLPGIINKKETEIVAFWFGAATKMSLARELQRDPNTKRWPHGLMQAGSSPLLPITGVLGGLSRILLVKCLVECVSKSRCSVLIAATSWCASLSYNTLHTPVNHVCCESSLALINASAAWGVPRYILNAFLLF